MKRTAVFLSSTLLIGIAIGLASWGTVLNAQEPKRTDVLTSDLAGIAGKRATIYRVEIPPGVAAGRHRHPVDTFVYVLDGTLTLEQDGQGPRTLKAGEVFQEVPGGIYNARNTGTRPLMLLVVSLGEKDQPFSVPVK
jgi:quercetin dioxygenase-like cupin family protein